jgi:hypothetical protein
MGTDKLAFEGVLWAGATGSHVTGSDVSHVTGRDVIHVTWSDLSHVPCPEVCSTHAQPDVDTYPP